MKKIIPLALLTFAVALTGCSDPEPAPAAAPVSEECTAAMQKLETEGNEIYESATEDTPGKVLNAPEIYPLEACADFAEYSKAGISNPGAWGMSKNTEADMERLVGSACAAVDEQNTTPVCSDAMAQGLLS